MNYDRIDTKIEATATAGSGRLTNLELIYQGEVLPKEETDTENSLSKTITEKGWYTAKATDTKGRSRYAWTRANSVSGNLESPKIEVTKGVSGVENWYRDEEDGNFEISINAVDELSSKIYYRIVNSENVGETEENWTEVAGTTVTLTKDLMRAGQNKIYAYVADESGKGTSEDSYYFTVNYDNTKPTASFTINGENYTEENWHNTDVSIEVTGEDSGSGINGYIYYLNGSETGITEKDILKPITIIAEGENTIQIETIDKAGNVSERKEAKIKLDKTAPKFEGIIEKTEITKTGFTVNVVATDNLSGNKEHGGNITYNYVVTENGSSEVTKQDTNTSGTLKLTDLKENTRYDINITAIDVAGNSSKTKGFGVTGSSGNGSGGNQGGSTTDPENPDKPPESPDPDKPTIDPGDLDPSKPGTDYPTIDGDIIPDGVTVGNRTKVTLAAATGKFVKQKYFTGKVRITLTDSEAVAGEATTLNYIIYDNRGSVVKGGQGAGPSTSFDFNREGIYILRAWTTNDTGGRLGDVTGLPLIVDQTAPTLPTIALTGKTSPIKNSIWFQSDITATISVGQDATSGVWGIGYYVEGANEIKNTASSPRIDYETRDTVSITINVDGKSTIYAYTIDDVGHVSNVRTKDAWKDDTPPSKVEISVLNTVEMVTYLSVTTADATSGPAKYIFETRTPVEAGYNENEWENRKEVEATDTLITYGYKELQLGGTYDIRVTVIDNAGKEKEEILPNTKIDGTQITQNDVGKTVDYVSPTGKTYSTKIDNVEYSGYSSGNPTFNSSDIEFAWRIWDIDSKNLYLISDKATTKKITLYSFKGYNNGVTLLDNVCNTLYANSTTFTGMIGRNLKVEDIANTRVLKDLTSDNTKNTYDNYEKQPYQYNFAYPYIWSQYEQSKENAINNRSTAYPLTTSERTSESLNVKPWGTVWLNLSMDKSSFKSINGDNGVMLYNLVIGTVDSSNKQYWLSSRCVNTYSKGLCAFALQLVSSNGVDFHTLAGTNSGTAGGNTQNRNAVRPLLVIPLSSCYITEGGTNGEDFHISPR